MNFDLYLAKRIILAFTNLVIKGEMSLIPIDNRAYWTRKSESIFVAEEAKMLSNPITLTSPIAVSNSDSSKESPSTRSMAILIAAQFVESAFTSANDEWKLY